MDIIASISNEFKIKTWQVENVVSLIDGGNTIPFIARYRKEAHGSLDDQVLREISERLIYLRNLDKRRFEIFSVIEAQEKMTDEIAKALETAATLSELEDIYRPYKQKRRTRAGIAKEKGLEPLALKIYEQKNGFSPSENAEKFINPELGVETVQDALDGANDIIAEMISDNADIRRRLKNLFTVVGEVKCVGATEEDSVYSNYYDYSEPVSKITPHRVLAIDRGERDGILKVSIKLDIVKAMNVISSETLKNLENESAELVRLAGEDAYNRLIYPSVENEIRNMLTENACKNAIKVFSANLRQLLLQPPVKGFVALGLDPGYRTGCKVAVVDETGLVLDTGVIYPVPPHNKKRGGKKTPLLND